MSRESEYEYQVEARSLSLEALREVRSSYKASRNMTFAEYLNVFDPERSIRLNVNTISDRSRKLEWTGEDTILARILSLATKFDAEIAFETELNDDYSLKEFRLNVHALNELGKDRTGIPFRISNSQLKLIKFKSSIDEFYSAIRGTGKDGLTISGLDKKVYDDKKKLLFYTSGGTIYAPQARDKFISITNKKTSDGYIVREFDNTEHETKEALYAYMLGELKKHCEPQIDYTIDGYIDADVNDKVLLIDDKYTTDDLMLTARVNKQKWSLIDKLQGNNRTELSNYVRVYNEIADELITRMNALIEANKVYDVQILTSDGYSFKNGKGSTTLTARVMDGAKDVTNEFSLTWFKNSTEYSHDASIIVRAGSIDDLATYLIIAGKDGRERGRNELTVFNVKDGTPGKTPVVHLAWADSADGSVGFSLELPTTKTPKYRGYYVDYSKEASTNPKVYKWERNPDDAAKVADEAKDKADAADSKADSAIDTANSAKDTADEASKQTALVNGLANAAKELADKAKADAAEANRLIGLTNSEISKLNTNVNNVRSDLASAETDLASKIETVKTTLTQNYATKTNLSETQLTLNKTITDSVASVKQEMSEKYAVKSDLTSLQGEYNSFKEETAKKFSQQVSSIETIQTNTTEAQKLAGNAYNKAQSAATSATNASSTANSALDKASDASNVANSASQNATNAVASANSAVSTANTAKSNADKAIADVAALTKTVSSQSTRIEQTSSRIDQVASGVTEVGSRLDNLQVGGTNLIRNTNTDKMYMSWSMQTGGYERTYYKDNGVIVTKLKRDNVAQSGWSVINIQGIMLNKLKPNTQYVMTMEIMSTGGKYLNFSLRNGGGSGAISNVATAYLVANEFTKVSFILTTTNPMEINDQVIYITEMDSSVGAEYHFKNIKMEEGNTPTAWSPAPEDQQSQIDGINSNIANNYYAKTTVDSKLSTAVSGITAQYTSDINTRLGNYYDKTTLDRKLTIDGLGIETYVKDTKSKLDNLQVGGRNLLLHSEVSESNMRYFEKQDVTVGVVTEGSLKYYKIKINDGVSGNSHGIRIANNYGYYNLSKGKHYIFSYWIKTNVDYRFAFNSIGHHQVVNGTNIHTDINNKYNVSSLIANKWTKVTIEFDTTVDAFFIPYIWFVESGMEICVYDMMLEEGNTPTAWSPAPEDMATLTQYTEVKQLADRISSTVYDSSTGLTTKVNQLAGKYAITALNSAGDILASLNLNANTSTAEINAKLIRLNGSTKMDDAFINKLAANSIITNKIKSTEISGDYIRGGTIDGTIIKSTGPNGTTKLTDGWFISTQNNAVGHYGAQSVDMTIYDSGQYAGSTKLTYNGFINEMKNNNGVFAKRKITFHAEGFKIEPEDTNVGTNLNSGMNLVGRKAYLDFVANTIHRDDATPYYLRIIANEDGKSFIESTQGRLEIYTKNQEQLVVNSNYIPQTSMDNNTGIKQMVVAKPNESGSYMEIRNRANKAWGITVWQSDQRLKNNIKPSILDSLDKINQLAVRQFNWRSDGKHEDFGLIAQEVEQILPNAVFKVGDYYQIKDSGLIPVLIGAVQKLSNKVNLLENIIYNTKGSNLL
ncbi:tail fiber domain-containing protein [Enterococcus cecorum]|uniref:tail fiber domain-containing protein n=1 Tax=Enterococcus cecorum TaxID=44008 RepID=UPI001F3E0888|nr:tail fiber domain-containing protein [Enterococcus cecorum]